LLNYLKVMHQDDPVPSHLRSKTQDGVGSPIEACWAVKLENLKLLKYCNFGH